jgi:hypothetical protein
MSLHRSFQAFKDRIRPKKIFTFTVDIETFDEHASKTTVEFWSKPGHILSVAEITTATTILGSVNKAPIGWTWTFDEARNLLQDMCLADVQMANYVKRTVRAWWKWLLAMDKWNDGLSEGKPEWESLAYEYNETWNERRSGEEDVNAKEFPRYVG